MTRTFVALATAVRKTFTSETPTACERIGNATWIALLLLLAASMAFGFYAAITP